MEEDTGCLDPLLGDMDQHQREILPLTSVVQVVIVCG